MIYIYFDINDDYCFFYLDYDRVNYYDYGFHYCLSGRDYDHVHDHDDVL